MNMMSSKPILKSKTVLAAITATLVLWAPQFGLDFSQEDASFVTENYEKLVASIAMAVTVFGRVVADTKVRFGLK